MKNNNIKLSENIEIKAFKDGIFNNFQHNFTLTLCDLVSKLLAIDYATRLASKFTKEDHVNNCVTKLRNYLGYRVIEEEDFATSLTLFSIAISPEIDSNNDKSTNPEQSIDDTIEVIISSHFGQVSSSEQALLKIIVKALLTGDNNKEILNFINSDPKIFYSIILTASKSKKHQQEIAQIAHLHINNIISKSKKLDKKMSKIRSFSQRATLVAGIMLTASVAFTVGGLLMPALAVGAIIASVKLAPLLGDKIADININSNQILQTEQKALNSLKIASIDLDPQTISMQHSRTKETLQEITQDLAINAIKPKSFAKERQSIVKETKYPGRGH